MVLRGSRFKWRRDCLPRLWKGVAVYTALLITPAGDVQEITVYSPSAINAILRDSCVDCLTSNDGVIDFWFRSAVAGRYRPNQQATGLLLSVTTFSVRTVPLLYGSVVVCSKSSDGRLLGLTTQDRRGLRDPGRLRRMWLHRRFRHARGWAPPSFDRDHVEH